MKENKELKLVYETLRKPVTVENLGNGRYQVCTCCCSNNPDETAWAKLKRSGMKYDFKGPLCRICNYWPWVRK